LIVFVLLLAPIILTPSLFHWYVIGGVPLAIILNVTSLFRHLSCEFGCISICAGVYESINTVSEFEQPKISVKVKIYVVEFKGCATGFWMLVLLKPFDGLHS